MLVLVERQVTAAPNTNVHSCKKSIMQFMGHTGTPAQRLHSLAAKLLLPTPDCLMHGACELLDLTVEAHTHAQHTQGGTYGRRVPSEVQRHACTTHTHAQHTQGGTYGRRVPSEVQRSAAAAAANAVTHCTEDAQPDMSLLNRVSSVSPPCSTAE